MSLEDRIKVVMIGKNPNFTKEEFKKEMFKKWGLRDVTRKN